MMTHIPKGEHTENRPLPKAFVLELTRSCNNACSYCYNIWRVPKFADKCSDKGEMSTREIKETIIKLQQDTRIALIALSGGEPTLRPDLPEIIKFLRSCDILALLLTNGTLLTEDLVEAMVKGAIFQISLLSYRKEIHDRMAGRKGAWDATVEGIMNVHAAGGSLSVVFVATPMNWKDLEATAMLAMMLGVKAFIYKRVNIGAANFHDGKELFLTPAMIEENLNTLDKLAAKYRLQITADVVIEPCIVDIRQFKNINFGWCSLAGESAAFVIDPAGDVRICEHSPVVLGNIKRERFGDIYRHPYVTTFRSTWPEECRDCKTEFREMCRGGCKAAAEQVYGSIKHVDPFVRINR